MKHFAAFSKSHIISDLKFREVTVLECLAPTLKGVVCKAGVWSLVGLSFVFCGLRVNQVCVRALLGWCEGEGMGFEAQNLHYRYQHFPAIQELGLSA